MALDPEPRPRRKGERYEEPEGFSRPPQQRPKRDHNKNPMRDPLAGIKRPLKALNGPSPGTAHIEFTRDHVIEIRMKFHATQRQFARLFGISIETLRNWEQGKRRPHGPARALLRVAQAHPEAVVRALWEFRRNWWLD